MGSKQINGLDILDYAVFYVFPIELVFTCGSSHAAYISDRWCISLSLLKHSNHILQLTNLHFFPRMKWAILGCHLGVAGPGSLPSIGYGSSASLRREGWRVNAAEVTEAEAQQLWGKDAA